ncbi:MAG: exodeoxyribonuclease V subunit gamma [Desulfobacterales bacterium]|nr:exodeoxyribonuclease V subunit gamma [Desulfobacterales bacterium]
MAGLVIITSNRMDLLVGRLADVLRRPAGPPLSAETIVVQSRGMERWVAMELARLNGISANLHFLFPNAFLESTFRALWPDLAERSGFEPELLAFRIMARVRERLGQPAFAPLQRFLDNDHRAAKLYQLSRIVADLFDQYLVFRPDMVERWEQGRIDPAERDWEWQALLWRELAGSAPAPHRARLRRELLSALRRRAKELSTLPSRVSIFGISYLPRFHLEIFSELAQAVPVTLYSLTPCREYWADIASEREAERRRRRHGFGEAEADLLHIEPGNRLLAAWGRQGRDFLDAVTESGVETVEQFIDPDPGRLIGRLQADILNLREPEPIPGGRPDGSLQVHACHSPMRETEVLHDQLLAMFAAEPDLQPRDVIVMTPDIETYAPFIAAVFGAQSDPRRRIPFTVADRSPQREAPTLQSFFALLDLRDSRFETAEILRLLEAAPIRTKFGLEEPEVLRLEAWIRQAGVCWGKDTTTARELGLPPHAENTWQAGIERLLLGYALPPSGTEVFQGLRGCNALEGSDLHAAGRFLAFLERLFNLSERLRVPHRLGEWQDVLKSAAAEFFPEEERGEGGLASVNTLLEELGSFETLAGLTTEVPLDVVRAFLSSRLEAAGAGRGFLSGGVTFCAMLPMRSIPFEVVCLVGMNHDAFPRDDSHFTFDLMGQSPKPGDRSRRNDDKYIFLESLMAARRRFYISYVGQSIQDNSPIPPSVVVSDLLDALDRGYGLPPESGIVVRHRLQAFSDDYFRSGSGLFSFSRENAAACAAARVRRPPPAFFPGPVPLSAAEAVTWGRPDLRRLSSFFANPCKCLLRDRLDIHLDPPEAVTVDHEPFTLEGRERFEAGSRLLEHRLEGRAPAELFAALKAAGRLPHGSAGEAAFEDLWAEVDRLAHRLEPFLGTGPARALEGRWPVGGVELSARLTRIRAGGCLGFRFGRLRARDVIDLWLEHLVLCMAQSPGSPAESRMVCNDYTLRLAPAAESLFLLEELITLYRRGIESPLCFFPEASLAYARGLNQSEPAALAAARNAWERSVPPNGEAHDPYYRRCFDMEDPFGAAFAAASRQVFDPILARAEFQKA